MVPPAATSASSSTAMPEPSHGEEAAKCRCRRARSSGAWAHDISMGVMTAAVALFILFSIAACLLMTPLVFAARALRRQARRYGAFSPVDHPRPRPRHTGLASEQISRLPTFESSPFDRNSACIVCLEAARGGERWRALPPCGHAFHTACIDPWLLLSPACPVCRATVAVLPRSESQAGDGIEKPPLSLYFSPPHGG